MATLTAQTINEDGLTATYASAGGSGDVVDNGGGLFLHVKNGSGSEMTVTITAQTTSIDTLQYGEVAKSNATKAIAASAEAFIGPFKPAAFNNNSSQIAITYSSATSVTIAALILG